MFETKMECYRTKDDEVAKYVHEDGSETAIKAVTKKNPELGHDPISCSKWALFLSSSVGCQIGCKFCHLTLKKFPYNKLPSLAIYNNAIDAIDAEIKARPVLKRKFFKLSWMGMGDPMMIIDNVPSISKCIIKHVRENGLSAGCEGIDMSTTLPINMCQEGSRTKWIEDLKELNEWLEQFPKNEINDEQNSRLRFFYSLMSMDFIARRSLVGGKNTVSNPGFVINKVFPDIKKAGIDTICHHILLDGVNDSDKDLQELTEWFADSESELRLLRYNTCTGSPYKESPRFDEFAEHLKTRINRLRCQISVGSEVKSACGMFLMPKSKDT